MPEKIRKQGKSALVCRYETRVIFLFSHLRMMSAYLTMAAVSCAGEYRNVSNNNFVKSIDDMCLIRYLSPFCTMGA